MRKALCVKNLDSFNQLAEGKIETLEAQLVDRDICECVENGWFQLIPYVSFSHLDVEAGRLNVAAYRRPDTGEGEARLQGDLSVGFGGHIDNDLEVYHTDSYVNEEGQTVYKLTVENIKETAIVCAVRELKEELGFNPFEELQIGDDSVYYGLEREPVPDEVGTVHLCLSIKVNLTGDRFADFFAKAKPNEAEILDLRPISIDLGAMLKTFNMASETQKLVEGLDNLKAESWSKLVVLSTLATVAVFVRENFNMATVFNEVQKQREEQARLAAKEEADRQAAYPAVVTDTEVKDEPVQDQAA